MSSQSDNWSYKRFLLPFVWKFDDFSRKYIQHPQIHHITEIALAMPTLYISQSALTLLGMSGYSPLKTGIGVSNNIYNDSFIPKFISISIQKFYTIIFNFWYIFALLNILGALLFVNNVKIKRASILMSLIPLYYGVFIVFAAQFEFSRLMMPIAPFIIYNYVAVIIFMSKAFVRDQDINEL